MMNEQTFNDATAAIHLEIQQKKYNRALLLLESMHEKTGHNSWVIWQITLMAATTGNLPLALASIKELPEDFSPAVKQLQQTLENQMEAFNNFIFHYNEVISMIKAGRQEDALDKLNQEMDKVKQMPLLPAVYKTKLLLMWKIEHPQLKNFALDLPDYATDQQAIQAIFQLIKTIQPPVEQSIKMHSRKSLKPIILSTAAVVLLAATALVYTWQSNRAIQSVISQDETDEQTMGTTESQSSNNLTASTQEDADDHTKSTNTKSEEADSMSDEPADNIDPQTSIGDTDSESASANDQTITEKDPLPTSQTSIPEAVAKAYYTVGFDSYKAGDYPMASAYLEMVVAAEDTFYFTDDAAYFLVISYLNDQDYENVIAISNKFANAESVHFTESPYKNAISLQEGKALYHAGKEQEAIELLTELSSDPSTGWVKGEADKLLKSVVQHD